MSDYVKQRLLEAKAQPSRAWSSRAMPAPRLDREQKPSTNLYFIETVCPERFIKIGIASDVAVRLKKMQMGCPYELRVLAIIPNAANLEKPLHIKFVADRVTGEWFRRTDALLATIEELKRVATMTDPHTIAASVSVHANRR